MGFDAFQKRAYAESWIQKRDAYWNAVIDSVIEEQRKQVISYRVKDLNDTLEVRQDLLNRIKPKIVDGVRVYPVKPRSLEGMVNAVVRMGEQIEEKYTLTLNELESA